MSRDGALELRIDYRITKGAEDPSLDSRVTAETRPRRDYVSARRTLHRSLLAQIFGD